MEAIKELIKVLMEKATKEHKMFMHERQLITNDLCKKTPALIIKFSTSLPIEVRSCAVT